RRITTAGTGPVTFSPDGRLLALVAPTADGAGELQIWDVVGGRLVGEAPALAGTVALRVTPDPPVVIQAGGRDVSPPAGAGGRRLASWSNLPVVSAVAVTPDGRTLLTGHEDGTTLAWDLTPHRAAKLPPGDRGRLWAALADGRGEIALAAVEALV